MAPKWPTVKGFSVNCFHSQEQFVGVIILFYIPHKVLFVDQPVCYMYPCPFHVWFICNPDSQSRYNNNLNGLPVFSGGFKFEHELFIILINIPVRSP